MQVWPASRARWSLAAAVTVVVFGAGATLATGGDLWWLGAAAGIGGPLFYWSAMKRYLRRRLLVREPFPEPWREVLRGCVAYYGGLDERGRRRFEDDVRFFLAEQRIYGSQGAEVPDRIKVLVAASAATLGHGLPHWEWPDLRDIVIYRTAFDGQYREGARNPIRGMVQHRGPIIFSARDLQHGFCKHADAPKDGRNVGLHELAHVMDLADGKADGVPAGLEFAAAAPWIQIMAERLDQIRAGAADGVLRAYAGKNSVETFAVAVEVFFERPRALKRHDPDLYEMLAAYFRQDPARDAGGTLVPGRTIPAQ